MPGYAAALGYDGTETIELGAGYWVKVKKALTQAEKGRVDDLLGGKQRVDVAGQRQYAEMDYTASRTEMVVYSLDSWNLDDENGVELSLAGVADGRGRVTYPPGCERRRSVAEIIGPVFDQIYAVCDRLNAPRKGADAAAFRDEPVGGDPDGDDGTGGAAADAVGAGDVAAVRADEGDGG
jgi:hypothetical protein